MISVKGNTTSDDGDDFTFLWCLILDCGNEL